MGQSVNPPIEPWLRGSCGILPAEEAQDIGGRELIAEMRPQDAVAEPTDVLVMIDQFD